MKPEPGSEGRTTGRRWLSRGCERVGGRLRRLGEAGRGLGNGDRGDVPGWVMIAVMTAALVVAILVPFRNTIIPAMTAAIEDMFGQAR
jgi:hypothetical protein